MNYYNEFDKFAAGWLRELIKAGLIPAGDVDDRSIKDVQAGDLRGYTQCHFFAGIGGWPLALQLAGWRTDRPVWSGSCPCQPFSAAGRGDGFADDRHLWPEFHRLIGECRPAVVFGEQVASKAADAWFDLVQADVEALGYAFGVVAFPAASVGAPHIRDRAYWVADSASNRRFGQGQGTEIQTGRDTRPEQSGLLAGGLEGRPVLDDGKTTGMEAYGLDDTDDEGSEGLGRGHQAEGGRLGAVRPVAEAGESGGVADTTRQRCGETRVEHRGRSAQRPGDGREPVGLAHSLPTGWPEGWPEPGHRSITGSGEHGGMVYPVSAGLEGYAGHGDNRDEPGRLDAQSAGSTAAASGACGLADADCGQFSGQSEFRGTERDRSDSGRTKERGQPESCGDIRGLADAAESRHAQAGEHERGSPPLSARSAEHGGMVRPTGPLHSFWSDADWLLCRDGKWRPVIPTHVGVSDGLPNDLVRSSDSGTPIDAEKKEEVNGQTSESGGGEAVQSLPCRDDAQAHQRQVGGFGCVQSQDLLRSGVHGQRDGEGTMRQHKPQSPESEPISETTVRAVRGGGAPARPPQGRGPFQQHAIELDDVVPALPQAITLTKLYGRWRDQEALQALCAAICEGRSLQFTPEQAAAIWQSLGREDKDRIRVGVGHKWVSRSFTPLSTGEPARTGRLRGYGNAIVPQQAAEFVSAFMDYQRAVA